MGVKAKRYPNQPKDFKFSKENLKEIDRIIAKYPKGFQASAVMPLLDMAQRQHDNWIPEPAVDEIARILDMPRIKVYEVATFYTMYNLAPVGEYHLQLCTTTPCMLCGGGDLLKTCEKTLGIKSGETTKDGKFTLTEVECLGACVNAPMIQINDDYYEDLDAKRLEDVLTALAEGKDVPPGSQTGRKGSMAQLGPTSLESQAKKAGIEMATPSGKGK
ncbi:MAG: NADH-quinone oxidoreductase subunit NuoE [Pseudomonadota bacterium]